MDANNRFNKEAFEEVVKKHCHTFECRYGWTKSDIFSVMERMNVERKMPEDYCINFLERLASDIDGQSLNSLKMQLFYLNDPTYCWEP